MMYDQSLRKRGLAALLFAALISLGVNAQAESVDFSLPGLDGKTHRLSDYRGKWVVVNYWATWCPPCLAEIPELLDFHENNAGADALVLGINFEDIDTQILKQFADDYFISYPVLREKPARGSVMGDIPGLPTTFVISPEGEILARHVGSVTAQILNDFINEQKRERAGPPGFGLNRTSAH